MTINYCNVNQTWHFEDLTTGEVFLYQGCAYLKLENENWLAVNLESSELKEFSPLADVKKVDATLTIC